jgi:hypothetical protein
VASVWLGLIIASLCLWSGCGPLARAGEQARISFSIDLNPRVYADSNWGDPPQLAIWLRSRDDGRVRTVLVTHRTARGDWEGKADCPVSLPHWVGFYNQETGTKGPPTWTRPAIDGISRATPTDEVSVSVEVPLESRWRWFVEVNCSGDFNEAFPEFSNAAVKDSYGNGQPSLVYAGELEATPGVVSTYRIIGRSRQHEATGELVTDVSGVTTARS